MIMLQYCLFNAGSAVVYLFEVIHRWWIYLGTLNNVNENDTDNNDKYLIIYTKVLAKIFLNFQNIQTCQDSDDTVDL